MKNRNLFLAILMAMALVFNAGTAIAAGKTEEMTYVQYDPDEESDFDYGPIDEEPEWPVWEEEQSSFPPATSDNFIWKGHNPADEGWRAEEGDLDQATLIHWSDDITLTPLYFGGHILEIMPDGEDATIIAKDFTGNAGDALVINWARVFNDYAPYMDSVFGYMEDAAGKMTTAFSSIVTDGSSSGWEQSWTFLETSGTFTLYLGAMNGIDGAMDPKLLIGGINIYNFDGEKGFAELSAAPVPVPPAGVLLVSAVAGLALRRRKTT